MDVLLGNLLLLFLVFGGLIYFSPRLGFPDWARGVLAVIFLVLVVLLFLRGPFFTF